MTPPIAGMPTEKLDHPFLRATKILEQCGLYIYMEKVIYCDWKTCQKLLLKSEAAGHFAEHLKQSGNKTQNYLKGLLQKELDGFDSFCETKNGFFQFLGENPLERAQIPLFDVEEDGVLCPVQNCRLIFANKDGLIAHKSKKPDHSFTMPQQLEKGSFQRVWLRAKSGSLLHINPQLSRPGIPASPKSVSRHSLEQSPWVNPPSLSDSAALRDREQAHVFSEIGFTCRINDISFEIRNKAISITPTENLLMQSLNSISFQYLSNALDAVDSLAVNRPHYLRDISPPRAMLSKTTFGRVQNTATIKRYSRGLAKLVLFAMRVVTNQDQSTLLASATINQINALKCLSISLRNNMESAETNSIGNDAVEETLDWDAESEQHSNLPAYSHSTEGLLQAFHTVVMSVYSMQAQGDEVSGSHILPTFIILISLDESRKQFKCPRLLTSTYAAFKYIAKSAITQELFSKSNKGIHTIDKIEYEKIIYWVIPANPTPFDWLSNKQTRLSTYVRRLPGLPSVSWFEEDTEDCYLTYSGLPVEMSIMDSFIMSLCETLQSCLSALLQGFEATSIPIHQIKESVHNDKYCYSYLSSLVHTESDSRPIHLSFYIYIIHTAQLQTKIGWDAGAVSEYLLKVNEFVTTLFLAIYFSSGMAPRGEDLLSATIRNTEFMNRSLYWLNGDLVLKGNNSKTASLTQMDSNVVHALAPIVTACLLVYQTYVLPAVHDIFRLSKPLDFEKGTKDRRAHPLFTHLFAIPAGNGLLTMQEIGICLKNISETWFGQPLGISDWRHILLAIGRKQEPLFEKDYTALETQSGHSVETGFKHYGILHQSFPGIPEPLSEKQIRLSKAWQGLWGLRDYDVSFDTPTGDWARKIHNLMQKTGSDFDLKHFLKEEGPMFPWLLDC